MKNLLSKLSSLFTKKDFNDRESSLNIAQSLKDFVEDELLPGLNFTPNYFWMSLENILEKLLLTLLKMACFYPLLERTCNSYFNINLAGCIGDILCGIFQEGKTMFKVMD